MKPDMAFDIINQCYDLGVNSLKFNHRGEPTMHPMFRAITDLAREFANGSTFIDRITNSNFNFPINREDIFNGLCNQTKVKVSFDSFRKEIFESQRKGSNYEKTIANIDKFYHYEGRDNVLVVQSVRTKRNWDEDLESEIKKRWPSAVASIRDVVEGRTQQKDYSDILVKDRSQDRKPCQQAFVRLVIGHDGKVMPCCPDIGSKLVIGDVNDRSVYDIFNSYTAKILRRSLKSGDAFLYDPCRTCPSHESYKGFKPKWNS